MIDEVVSALKEVAAELVIPRFRHLGADDVMEKSPGDLVTIVDQQAEAALTARLGALLQGSLVVGEEAVAADHRVLERIGDPGPVWIIDPIDGTGNFAAGREPFAMMVALLRGGETVLGAIYEPMTGLVSVAEKGSGTYINGDRMRLSQSPAKVDELRGALLVKYLPERLREQVRERSQQLAAVFNGHACAGREYPDLVQGKQDFALFWKTLPWDHAPGSLLVREAGGVAQHFDGSQYDPAQPKPGLLVCRSAEVFEQVRIALLE
jgi:fructose-1,6-bisphosphatase/inositol monophosphatase family enzyme